MESWKNELYHYGVLGMKWGIRRYQPYSANPRKSGKTGKEVGEAAKEKSRAERTVVRREAKAARKENRALRAERRYEKAKYKYYKGWSIRRRANARNVGKKLVKKNKRDYRRQKWSDRSEAAAKEYISKYGKKSFSSIDRTKVEKYKARTEKIMAKNYKKRMKYLRRGDNVKDSDAFNYGVMNTYYNS